MHKDHPLDYEVIAKGVATIQDIQALEKNPPYRRATQNMLWALSATQNCIKNCTPDWSHWKEKWQPVGMVLATHHGELQATTTFLKELALEHTAHPVHFQNSLHHSTLGFLSIALDLKGPAYTVSQNNHSEENALDLARCLLEAKDCNACFVVCAEVFVPEIDNITQWMDPLACQWTKKSYGRTVLLKKVEKENHVL